MSRIDIDDAKARINELIAEAVSGEEIVITQNERPIVKLVAVSDPEVQPVRIQPGSAIGLMTVGDDFYEPLSDFEEYM